MKLRFTRTALTELDEIFTYVAVRSPNGARRVEQRLQAVFAKLLRNPKVGRHTMNGQLRRVPATPLPYLVFYETTKEEVVIVGVRHGARDPSSMPDG